MKNTLFRKGLVVGIILLFVVVGFLSCVSSRDLSIYNKKMLKDEIESIDNTKIRASDDFNEIITYIVSDWAGGNWIKRRGIFRGEVTIFWKPWCECIDLYGLRFSNGKIERYQELSVNHVHIPHYIGYINFKHYKTRGIALGNIEWSQ